MNKISPEEAYKMLMEESKKNPGNWVLHSVNVGKVAKKIASKCGLDEEKAEVMGYLHDIGRRYGVMKERHALMGYKFLMERGYEDIAKICITHIFFEKDINSMFNAWDGTNREYEFVKDYLNSIEYDIYDELIQLADCMALHNGVLLIERRLVDCALRYKFENTKVLYSNWEVLLKIQNKFEKMIGESIYMLFPEIEKDIYRPIKEALSYKIGD